MIPSRLTDIKCWGIGEKVLDKERALKDRVITWKKMVLTWFESEWVNTGFNDGNPDRYFTYDEALDAFNNLKDLSPNLMPPCFVMPVGSGLVCVDLDKVFINDVWVDKKLEAHVKKIINFTWAEYSNSKAGMHLFIEGKLPTDKASFKQAPIDLFQHKQQIWITGNQYPGSANIITPQQEWLDELIRDFMAEKMEKESRVHKPKEKKSSQYLSEKRINGYILPKLKRSKFWEPVYEDSFIHDIALVHKIIDCGVTDFDQICDIFRMAREDHPKVEHRIDNNIMKVFNERVNND